MITEAIILSAGRGSRLLPITATRPKCLVDIGGQSLLSHQLKALENAGLENVTVVTGYRHDQIEEAVSQCNRGMQVQVRFNPFWAVASSIGSVWAVRDRLHRPFVLLNGDTLFDAQIVAQALRDAGEGVSLVVETLHEPAHDDMLATVQNARVLAVAKDLDPSRATHRSLGLVLSAGGSDYRTALDAVIAKEYGVGAFHHAIIDRIAKEEGVSAIERVPGLWQEIDQPGDISDWHAMHGRGNV